MLAAYDILVLCNVVLEAPSNIAEEENSGNSVNVLWTTSCHSVYLCIYQVLDVKKYKVMLSLLWKLAETNAETAARHSTQQPVKFLVGHYLKK